MRKRRYTPEDVAAWNLANPVGTRVRFWKGLKEGPGKIGHIRAAAVLSENFGSTPVAWVDTHGACLAITHIEPAPRASEGRPMTRRKDVEGGA